MKITFRPVPTTPSRIGDGGYATFVRSHRMSTPEPQLHPTDTLSYDEWWAEFRENACCPDRVTAAHLMCGCGGSGQVPSGISRLLTGERE